MYNLYTYNDENLDRYYTEYEINKVKNTLQYICSGPLFLKIKYD